MNIFWPTHLGRVTKNQKIHGWKLAADVVCVLGLGDGHSEFHIGDCLLINQTTANTPHNTKGLEVTMDETGAFPIQV
jgi:hypothetical protein